MSKSCSMLCGEGGIADEHQEKFAFPAAVGHGIKAGWLYEQLWRQMSFFGSIYADPDLPHRARTVYMYLRDRAGGGSCWPGVKTIARDLHLSPRTVQRALNDLERAGYIQRQRRHRENGSCASNLYIITNEVK